MESQFGKMLWNAAKLGALFFVVGALLSYAVPYFAFISTFSPNMAAAITAVGVGHNPIYLGLLFGGFGVLDAVVRPAADYIFGKDAPETTHQPVIIRENTPSQQVHIHQAPQLIVDNTRRDDFAKTLTDKRQQQNSSEIKI